MLSNIFGFWRNKETKTSHAYGTYVPKTFDPFPETSATTMLYKMKYDGADPQENFHKGLHRLRKSIKRLSGESLIAKQELRHATRACRRLKKLRRQGKTTTQYKHLYNNNATANDIYELGVT